MIKRRYYGEIAMGHCEHCQFFEIVMVQGPTPGDRLIGHCHKLPPTAGRSTSLKAEAQRAELSPFPLVKASDWCGEFQPATTAMRRLSAPAVKEPPSQDMRLVVSAREAAKMLDVSERLLFALTARGEVPRVKIGKRVCYRVESLRTWLATNESPALSTHTCT